ncbi:4-hydroxy-tetrahydrodipicolinate synthase [Corynebacterium diphtheriae]|uniref:4-hydroxy-tetrahydrodipicolinate synthase n=1 Tax=Corynebacterium diphtheriae TaxID=1717 RepID=UPI0013CBA820|nr:4-hydroxy-tetrahydrodipicolinate synthase [Corynebacterium diphtheriae]MBG9293372.1 4-hydroxy-tetrahydrodipicolinate synthase [Corynebacterium diphtheriae bv. mitis]CAB0559033.1 4-hydroxy-tetrahydrodipicolinate synthase [Corynebacterium diphtheriae]CAB0801057.1 4-hydroxy-tetrahydrodipicolinate synthase [Corynebacterium diphtheriae]CAB0804266.1 4-hydroxy-tetrahydrodipicolinate synthase [Corynebacterium diphtheriae]CAB0820915.1 4-hydroxy-tetrahydrodipicolinate synthase [Corynebacterium diphth
MSTGLTANNGIEEFGTIAVAMVTPFDANGALDIKAGQKLAAHLVSNGIDSLVLAGTTGESPTTSLEEKIDLLKAVKAEVGDSAKLIAGAGTNNTAASVEMARASAEAGADALLVVTPYYSKPSQEGIYQHFRTVSEATDLPICAYDIPPRSVVPIAPDTLCRLAALPMIKAVKDAKGDITAATTLIAETGLAWYSGDDPLNLPWLSVGATGFISVIGHLAPQLLREMYTNFNQGNLEKAREINAQLAPLVAAQARLGGVSLAKAGLRLQGIEVGDPRLPIVAPSEPEIEDLRRDMNKTGVL